MSGPVQAVVNEEAQAAGITVMVLNSPGSEDVAEHARTMIYGRHSGDIYLSAAMFDEDPARWLQFAQAKQIDIVMHGGHPYFPSKWIAGQFPDEVMLAQGMAKLGHAHIERGKH